MLKNRDKKAQGASSLIKEGKSQGTWLALSLEYPLFEL